MVGSPPGLDRQVALPEPETPEPEAEGAARAPEIANSLLAGMAESGLDRLLELFSSGLEYLDFYAMSFFEPEGEPAEAPSTGTLSEPAAVPPPAASTAVPTAPEVEPGAVGAEESAADYAPDVLSPGTQASGVQPAVEPAAGAPGPPDSEATGAAAADEPAAKATPAPAARRAEPAGRGGSADDGPLGAWRAKVHRAVAQVRRPKLTGGQGEAVTKAGRDVAGKHAAQSGKVPDEAKQAVPKPQQPADLPPFPDDETKAALGKLDPRLGRTHSAHTLPTLMMTPRGTVPKIAADAAPAPTTGSGGTAKATRTADAATDIKGEKGLNKGKKETPKAGVKGAGEAGVDKVPAAGATVSTEAPEIPTGEETVRTKSDVGAVVARLLAEPDKHAQRVIGDAVRVAYRGKLAESDQTLLSQPMVPAERTFVDQELRRIATVAGDSEQVLNEKIAAARADLSADAKVIEADLGSALETARTAATRSGAALERTIAEWHGLVDGQVEERAAAAKGDVDVAKIRADRERLVGLVNVKSGQGIVAYEAAAKKLKFSLGAEVDKQRRAYADADDLDKAGIETTLRDAYVAAHPDQAVAEGMRPWAEQARIDYRPSKYWLDERMAALSAFQAAASRTIGTEAETFTSDLNDAANQARDDIREWAARRLGYERSWLQTLLDMIADWMAQSRVRTDAWARRRATEAAAQVDTDLQFLEDEANKLARMSKEQQQRELASLRADQQVIVASFLNRGGEDALGAVADAMIFRLSAQRRGDLLKAFDAAVMGRSYEEGPELVFAVAKAESPGIELRQKADRLYDAFGGPGTTESEVFEALASLTPIGGKALEFMYRHEGHGNLKDRLKSELDDWLTWSKHDINRAEALLAGKTADAIAVQLDQAMHGNWNGLDLGGTDEATVFEALRNKSPEEIAEIKKAYKDRYHKDLELEVQGEMETWIRGTHDEDRAAALFKSDTELADVISLDQAMHGGWLGLGLGTDRKTLENVYITNDKELEREGDAKGWDSKTLADKKTERRAHLDSKYAHKYKQALDAQFVDEMSGAELDLVAGLREQKWNKVDAARIAQEHDSIFYADDKVINDSLQGHFKRKYADEKRDRNLKIDEEMAEDSEKIERAGSKEERVAERKKYAEKWPPERVLELRKQALNGAREAAETSAQENFPQLEGAYDKAYKGKTSLWSSTGKYGGLRADVAQDTQLTQHAKAQALIEGKGTLTEVQEVHYAIKGAGTDTDIVRDIFKGKDKKDMDTLGGDWEKEHPKEGKFEDFVLGDFSGREYQEMDEQIEFGEAETPRQKADRAKRLLDFENSTWLDLGSSHEVDVMKRRYDELEKDAQAFEANESKKGQPGYDWELHATLAGKTDASAADFDSAVTSHRKSVDVISDTVTQVVGAIVTVIVVVAAIAADIVTFGGAVAATPGVVAFLGSMWGAITVGAVGLGLTMLAKQAFTGKAYGWESIGTDLAVGVVDIATMALTAGMSGRILKGSKSLVTLFSKGRVGRILAKGVVQGAEGMVQAVPGAVLGQALDPENFRKGDNAILNVLGGAAVQVGVAGAMSAGMGMLHTSLQTDLVRMRTDPAYQNEMFERFQAKNPGQSRGDFMRRLDGLITKNTDLGFDDPRLQKAMRARLMEHIPASQRSLFVDVPIEVMPADQFQAFARSGSGNAVTVIRNGEPVVIMRGGAPLTELAFEGPHLQQVRDPKNAPRVALLEEARMEGWDKLSFDEQVEAYKAKVGLEIDAHEQILRSLDAQKGQAVDAAEWAQAREKAQTNLDNLRGQMEKVHSITPQDRATMMADPSRRPDFLDQPARLFSKDPRQRLATQSGPTAPPDVDQQRRNVHELRKQITDMEATLTVQGKLSDNEVNRLNALRSQLDDHYRVIPAEQQPAAEAKLFDPLPGESLDAYHERLKGMEAEVLRGASQHENEQLLESYQKQVQKTADDREELVKLRDELAAVKKDSLTKALEANADLKKRQSYRTTPDEHSKLSADRIQRDRDVALLRARENDLARRIDAIEKRPSLFFGDRPWTRLPLVDVTGVPIEENIGVFGELDAASKLLDAGFEPLGSTVDPRQVKSAESLDAAMKRRSGRQDIDGIFKRSDPVAKVTEYVVGDSKGTAEIPPKRPTGAGQLKKLKAGERQLSREWVDRHLGKAGLSARDQRNLQAGLKNPGEKVTVNHPDGTVDVVVVSKFYAQSFRDTQGAAHTRFFLVHDLKGGTDVTIGESYVP